MAVITLDTGEQWKWRRHPVVCTAPTAQTRTLFTVPRDASSQQKAGVSQHRGTLSRARSLSHTHTHTHSAARTQAAAQYAPHTHTHTHMDDKGRARRDEVARKKRVQRFRNNERYAPTTAPVPTCAQYQ